MDLKIQNYLVTVKEWFYAKDGQQYKAAWGKTRLLTAKELIGFNPTSGDQWALVVGEGSDDAVIIPGCQVQTAQLCKEGPLGNSSLKIK